MSFHTDEAKRTIFANARAAAGALLAAGVVKIVAEYSGTGDEGFVDEVTLHGPEDAVIPKTEPTLPDPLVSDLDDLCTQLVFTEIGVWYDGDGGFGVLSWDLATGEISLQHEWYETTSVSDPHTFTV